MDHSNTSQQVKALLKVGNRRAALALLSQALQADPYYTEGWWLLSFALEERSKQIYALQRVLQLSPHNPKVLERLAALAPQAMPAPPSLRKQMPASGALHTREGRIWGSAIAAGLLVTLVAALALTLAMRTSPVRAQAAATQPPPSPTASPPHTSATPASTDTPTVTQAVVATELPASPTVELLQPVTGDGVTVTLLTDADTAALNLPAFDQFVQNVSNGDANQRVGVFVEGQFEYPIVQQPASDPAWVSSNFGEVTEFRIVRQHTGNEGLLAHNYLAGGSFFALAPGDVARLVMGDGSVMEFEIYQIHSFQALNPNSATSDFLNLDTGEKISASEVFYRMYGGQMTLTFQTCINRDNVSTWGRTFIIGAEL